MFKITVIFLVTSQCCWGTFKTGGDQAWAGNLGWIDFGAERSSGVQIGEFYLAGHAYSLSSGWILFGDGEPANGIRYSNEDLDDFGVNRLADGSLRGWAYSPNLGWIAFHENGDPRMDILSGRFSGHAYALQAGWISLELLETGRIEPGPDFNGNGIPDSWELDRLGALVDDAGLDSDGDGMTDYQEYLADTDPLSHGDRFAISELGREESLEWTLEWRASASRLYFVESSDDLIEWRTYLGPMPGEEGFMNIPLTFEGENSEFFRVRSLLPTEIVFE